jgi:hypothetical protein
LVLDLLLE